MDGDTTFTKLFVGGLAWQTKRDAMRRYFEQFGEIVEAVVITDKHTGRSRGYGFVTFRDADGATRALQDPTPVIDGRRANCNLAALGASTQRVHTSDAVPLGMVRSRPATASSSSYLQGYAADTAAMAASYFPHHAHYAYPYYYGYAGGYSQENMYHMQMSYYGAYGGAAGVQQQPPSQLQTYYSAAGAQGAQQQGLSPYYVQQMQAAQSSSPAAAAAVAAQYSQMVQQYAQMQQATRMHATTVPEGASDAVTTAGVAAACAGTSSPRTSSDTDGSPQ